MFKFILVAVVVLLVCAFLYVRLNPLGDALHVDPETADIPKVPGHYLVRDGDGVASPIYQMPKSELAAKLEAIILATPRTEKMAGDLSDGFASFVTRSALWGFPDIANVKVVAAGKATSQLIILSRLRYGAADLGVNKARVEGWLKQLSQD